MEISNTEILEGFGCVLRLQARIRREICLRRDLSRTELDVMAFLLNNPGRDTASDIVELRMLPKGNVSQAVDALIRRGWLEGRRDGGDRRRVHLSPTAAGRILLPDLAEERARLEEALFAGFSEEERELFGAMTGRISRSVRAALESRRGVRDAGEQ